MSDFIDPLEGTENPLLPKANKLASQLNKFNKVFEQAEEVCSGEVVEFLDAKQKEVTTLVDKKGEIVIDGEVLMSRADVIKLQMMVDDYKEVRETLLDNTRNGKKILESMTLNLLDEDSETEVSPATVMAYSSLVGTINSSVKLLASSYKDISTVLLNLNRLDAGEKGVTINGDVNISQNTQVINTTDLIANLKRAKLS